MVFIFVLIYFFNSGSVYDGLSFSRSVYSRDGELLRLTLSGDEKYRIYTPLAKIDPHFQEAVLLLEDRYFYYHLGVNPIALAKAVFETGERSRGASTVTMQLARIRYGLRTRTWQGKLRQIAKALQLELLYSKKEILEAYLNLAPFGGPIEGVGAASLIYFHKSAAELTLSEILSLAVMPQSPTQRSLSQLTESAKLIQAKNSLFRKWLKEYPEDASQEKHIRRVLSSYPVRDLPFLAPHFVELALKRTQQQNIETTLDLTLQKKVEQKIKAHLQKYKAHGVNNAAVLVVNSESSEIVSYVGSGDFFSADIQGQVDGLQARRSPGSTLKPLVYALAFQQGLLHSHTLLKDTPQSFALYDPENFDQKFLGPLTAQESLILSRNIPAVYLNQQLQPTLFSFLKSANLYFPYSEEHYGLSVVLGGAEVSPWSIAELYNMLVHRGDWQELTFYKEQKTKQIPDLLTPESSFVTLDMLTHATRPHETYDRQWLEKDIPIAWKTGTSHAFRDAWTAGVAGPYVIVVWLGHFDNRSNASFVGRDLAAPLFFQIINSLVDFQKAEWTHPAWTSPAGTKLKKVQVCQLSGALPLAHCPHSVATWYHPGVSPIAPCQIHRPVAINPLTGLQSCDKTGTTPKIEVFEFWPSDLQRLFELAGIHRKPPPSFEKDCDSLEVSGLSPKIISPTENVSYLKSLHADQEQNTMTFEATADADVKTLFWFLDKTFIGKTKPTESIHSIPDVGDHILSVIDDRGRSDQKNLKVEVVR